MHIDVTRYTIALENIFYFKNMAAEQQENQSGLGLFISELWDALNDRGYGFPTGRNDIVEPLEVNSAQYMPNNSPVEIKRGTRRSSHTGNTGNTNS